MGETTYTSEKVLASRTREEFKQEQKQICWFKEGQTMSMRNSHMKKCLTPPISRGKMQTTMIGSPQLEKSSLVAFSWWLKCCTLLKVFLHHLYFFLWELSVRFVGPSIGWDAWEAWGLNFCSSSPILSISSCVKCHWQGHCSHFTASLHSAGGSLSSAEGF